MNGIWWSGGYWASVVPQVVILGLLTWKQVVKSGTLWPCCSAASRPSLDTPGCLEVKPFVMWRRVNLRRHVVGASCGSAFICGGYDVPSPPFWQSEREGGHFSLLIMGVTSDCSGISVTKMLNHSCISCWHPRPRDAAELGLIEQDINSGFTGRLRILPFF